MIIGVISDTHGLLRPQAIEALRGCKLILHAGDVGEAAVLDELRRIARVVAVRGNVDVEPWARRLPATEMVEAGSKTFYIVHRIADLDLKPSAAGIHAVIFGHSHQPAVEFRDGVLFFNPGSAGPRRVQLPVTVGRLQVKNGELCPESVPLLSPKIERNCYCDFLRVGPGRVLDAPSLCSRSRAWVASMDFG